MIKEELHRQNKMLREKIIDTGNILQSKGLDSRTEHKMKDDNMSIEEAKIEVQLMNPVSTMDSMIEALQCMKGMGVKAMSIHSKVFGDELATVMTINTKVLFSNFICYSKIYLEIIIIYIFFIKYKLEFK